MRILAVDPGTTETAWLVWDVEEARIVEFGKEQNAEFLARLRDARDCQSEHMALEMVASYGMSVGQEVFETVLWSGRFVEAWEGGGHRSVTWSKVYRKDVKLNLCGSYRAKDPNIRQALIDRIGPVGTKRDPGPCYGVSGDVWAALAVAITYADTGGAARAEAGDASEVTSHRETTERQT